MIEKFYLVMYLLDLVYLLGNYEICVIIFFRVKGKIYVRFLILVLGVFLFLIVRCKYKKGSC